MINKLSSLSTYIVRPGDTLWIIANKYNITIDQLKLINNIQSYTLIPGQILKVPTTVNKTTISYTVQPGDSLWTISKKFGMTVDEIKSINNLYNNVLYPGQILKVYSNPVYSTYTVKMGDSLWSIANYFGMTVEELKTLNNLSSEVLFPGETLTVIKRKSPPEVTTIIYTVKAGESLWDIANKLGTTIEKIKELNSLTSNIIYPGQQLIVSKDVTPTDYKILVKIKRYSGVIEMIPLEEYVTGVVSSELSAGFNIEAYKALALAARTYAVKRVKEGKVITDTDSHQVYKDKNQLKSWWGDDYDEIYNKISGAVRETKGEVISYDGEYIDALFFSTSNGRTEDPKYVWGGSLPYLKSVDSRWDTKSPFYYDVKHLTNSQFRTKLDIASTTSLSANIVSKTEGGSVNKINISGKTYTGEEVRRKLGLKSTDFDIKFENGKAVIRQRGWGHQVGLSQYGAHFMGMEGYNYKQIIKHYYPGVDIISII